MLLKLFLFSVLIVLLTYVFPSSSNRTKNKAVQSADHHRTIRDVQKSTKIDLKQIHEAQSPVKKGNEKIGKKGGGKMRKGKEGQKPKRMNRNSQVTPAGIRKKRHQQKSKKVKRNIVAAQNDPLFIKNIGANRGDRESCQLYIATKKIYHTVNCDHEKLLTGGLVRIDAGGRSGQRSSCFLVVANKERKIAKKLQRAEKCNTPGYSAKFFHDKEQSACVPLWENKNPQLLETMLYNTRRSCQAENKKAKRHTRSKSIRRNTLIFQDSRNKKMCTLYVRGVQQMKQVECKKYLTEYSTAVLRVGRDACFKGQVKFRKGQVCLKQITSRTEIDQCSLYSEKATYYNINGKCLPFWKKIRGGKLCRTEDKGEIKCFPEFEDVTAARNPKEKHCEGDDCPPTKVCDSKGNCRLIKPSDMTRFATYKFENGKFIPDLDDPANTKPRFIACLKICGKTNDKHCFRTDESTCLKSFQDCRRSDILEAPKIVAKSRPVSNKVEWVYLHCDKDEQNCNERLSVGEKYTTFCPKKLMNTFKKENDIKYAVACFKHCETRKNVCFRVETCGSYFENCKNYGSVEALDITHGNSEVYTYNHHEFTCSNGKRCDSIYEKRSFYCPAKTGKQKKVAVASLYFCNSKDRDLKIDVVSCEDGRYENCQNMEESQAEKHINVRDYIDNYPSRWLNLHCLNKVCEKTETDINTICPVNMKRLLNIG